MRDGTRRASDNQWQRQMHVTGIAIAHTKCTTYSSRMHQCSIDWITIFRCHLQNPSRIRIWTISEYHCCRIASSRTHSAHVCIPLFHMLRLNWQCKNEMAIDTNEGKKKKKTQYEKRDIRFFVLLFTAHLCYLSMRRLTVTRCLGKLS